MEFLQSIAPYAPIFLFNDNHSVNRAVAAGALSDTAVSGGLTGSLRNLTSLWHFDQQGLGNIETGSRGFSVASVRHGSNFDLVNEAVLGTASLVGMSRWAAGGGQTPAMTHSRAFTR